VAASTEVPSRVMKMPKSRSTETSSKMESNDYALWRRRRQFLETTAETNFRKDCKPLHSSVLGAISRA
jgi:hypothetical protein